MGATFARTLIEAGRSVYMVDIGARLSPRPGAHLKNSFLYQRNIDLFASVIRGHLYPLSIPTNDRPVLTLDPGSYRIDYSKYPGFIHNTQNPDQDPATNLPGAGVTYAVGGMTTHWTCATPRHHPTIERSDIYSDQDWERQYTAAEKLLNTHRHEFDHAIRHNVVRDTLQSEFQELPDPYGVQNLPLAVERRQDNPEFVHWTGTDTVLGALADGPLDQEPFILQEQHRCTRLVPSSDGSRIAYAEIQDLMQWQTLEVQANTYIVACNAYLTPQLLFASGIRPEPLGRYLTEQPMAFCQIVLKQDLVDRIASDPRWTDRVRAHRQEHPHDPVPIPGRDPEPQVWIPVSEARPWHCQIHRDAFHYGDVAPNVDGRLIVDLRWFGIVEQRYESRITFSERFMDSFGMPQPTFEWYLSDDNRHKQHHMMADMLRAANALTEPTRSHIQETIGTYVRLVIDEEWPRLASGHAGPQTSATLDRLWTVLRQNEPRTRREAIWHEQTLLSLKDLTRHREERLIAGRSQLQGVVWVALLLGSLVTVGYTYLYGVRNLPGQAIMTGAIAGLIGLMLALVVALDHPFTGPTSVTSEAFEMVLPTFGTHNQSIRNRSYSPARVPDRLPTRFTKSFGKTRRLRRGEKQVPSNKVTGIEVGLEHFATLANGQHIPNPRCFRTDEQALAKAQRRLRKTEQGTPDRSGWRRVVLSAGPQSPL